MEDPRDFYSGMANKENAAKFTVKKVKIQDIYNGKIELGSIVEIEEYVYRLFNPKRFERDGRERFLRTMVLGSTNGSIRVALWDKASILADTMPIERGDKILASNLMLRKGLTDLELSSTKNTFFNRIEPAKEGICDFSTLSVGEKDIDVFGKIVEIGSPRYFNDQNGKERKVVRCTLTDGVINLSAAFWDSSCDYVTSLHPGDFIKIEFASIKDNNGIEINAGNFSRVAANKIFKNRLKMLS